MLLSIDRVLQLLIEGKSLAKIAEQAECEVADVISILADARSILNKYEKPLSKKKVIIKKKETSDDAENIKKNNQIFDGSEFSAIPVNSTLTMYVDGASRGNPGPAGIGIVIFDQEDHQVGKVSSFIGKRTNNYAEYTAMIRALEIGIYFNAKTLKIRTDSELVVKQISGEYKVNHPEIKKLHAKAMRLIATIEDIKIEHVTRNFNDKADYLAKKAVKD